MRLAGGQGATWRAGRVVLKPAASPPEAEWVATLLATLPETGFRVSRPVRSASGGWTVAGWAAWTWVEGRHRFDRWPDVLAAGTAFHAALRDVPRPGFLDLRDDVWSVGDRAAWDDRRPPELVHPELEPVLAGLLEFRSPSRLPSQLVHGDLSGNVLFADPAAPAVIDFAPYWRPAEFALAVVAADAIAWHGAGLPVARALPAGEDPRSMLARAAIFRLVASDRAADDRMRAHPTYLRDNAATLGRVLRVLRRM